MLRVSLTFCCCLLFALSIRAQSPIKGRVMEDKTRLPLAGVAVDNLNTRQSVHSDNGGNFSINAEVNQVLVFKLLSYLPDTVLVTGRASLEVYLSLQTHNLKAVNVTTTEAKGSLKVYDPNAHGQTVNQQTDGNGRPIGGINIRMWYWKKDEHKRQRKADELKDEQTEDEITRTFSPANLANYVPLKGAEMEQFILLYAPTVAQWRDHGFNLMSYVSGCYKKFNQLPASERTVKDSL